MIAIQDGIHAASSWWSVIQKFTGIQAFEICAYENILY